MSTTTAAAVEVPDVSAECQESVAFSLLDDVVRTLQVRFRACESHEVSRF